MKKVLIIEDDPWFAQSLQLPLKAAGYESEIASNVFAAMEAVDGFEPDVILIDLLLAGSTAFNLMHELQSHSELANIPLIVCSNLAHTLSIKELQSYGVKKILNKSEVTPEEIVASVGAVL